MYIFSQQILKFNGSKNFPITATRNIQILSYPGKKEWERRNDDVIPVYVGSAGGTWPCRKYTEEICSDAIV